jgi:polysaccharide export outer membrane protein
MPVVELRPLEAGTMNVFGTGIRGRKLRAMGVLALCAFAACSNGPVSTFEELGVDGNTKGFGRRFSQDPEENEFVFGVGDEVLLEVLGEDRLTGRFAIRNDGIVSFGWVGEVTAAGLTPMQLRRKLEGRLALYLKDPTVTVGVGQVKSKQFYVAANDVRFGGVVLKALPYDGDVVLLDVYVKMGAPSSLLDDETHLKIIRGDPRKPQVFTVNVKDIYSKGLTGGNIQIRPDDIVYVPPTWMGHVNNVIAGVSVPFQSLFNISRTVMSVDYTVRILSGDNAYNRGYVF